MEKLVLYCKSYINDFERVKVLAESIKKYNMDNIPFYISVPKNDYKLFSQLADVNIVIDEDIYTLDNNWEAQQIIKSNFWKLNITENYLCLDSDSYFIKPFYISDFLFNEKEKTRN